MGSLELTSDSLQVVCVPRYQVPQNVPPHGCYCMLSITSADNRALGGQLCWDSYMTIYLTEENL